MAFISLGEPLYLPVKGAPQSAESSMEKIFERVLFAGRWIMAPFYAGLMLTLLILLYSFVTELLHLAAQLPQLKAGDVILGVLSLIDLSLAGNLLIIVIFSGYENFVSKIDHADMAEKLEWQGTVDFSSLKLKLVASIVAISGIHLLKVFMNLEHTPPENVKWMVIIHLVFVISGVMLALMDKLATATKLAKG
jgi:uncharacterized protein (TIGR00645 family)